MSRAPQTDSSPIPQPDEHTAPYWAALARGELLLRSCRVCEAVNHPVATLCRVCDSSLLRWTDVPPRGRLFSWAVEQRPVIPGVEPPYVIAQVMPEGVEDGGVRLACTLLVEDPSVLWIGMPVRLAPAPAPGTSIVLAHFVPL